MDGFGGHFTTYYEQERYYPPQPAVNRQNTAAAGVVPTAYDPTTANVMASFNQSASRSTVGDSTTTLPFIVESVNGAAPSASYEPQTIVSGCLGGFGNGGNLAAEQQAQLDLLTRYNQGFFSSGTASGGEESG